MIYKIGEAGLLAEDVGNTIFENFTIAECKRAGMEFYRTNTTKQWVHPTKSAIIGLSQGNADADISVYHESAGIITPRTDGFKAT